MSKKGLAKEWQRHPVTVLVVLIGSFTANVAGQACFNRSVDLAQAGQSALYGFGIGVSLVDIPYLLTIYSNQE